MKEETPLSESTAINGLYENYFLDYASYVILERAVPAIEDGLKPVQRRILHAMYELEDGRYNKVANIIGAAMAYHPHGDASISEAIITLGQKELLLDTQGNWGDIRTGDSAAAPRYIEARLSKFALDVVFNPKTTVWQLSYDGRKQEPVTLPVKFPLLLAQGADGIAVGLATKILPHNFCEIIKACIAYLQKKPFELFPDFPTGGIADVSDYRDGTRGGKVRIRAKIVQTDAKTLVIKEIPFGTTTKSICESIDKAIESGKIKIKKVSDNTAKDVEIEIQLAPGQPADITIDALYAFTDCEITISPNACVIIDEKPKFLSVSDILKISTDNTVKLLKQELEIKRSELLEKIFFSSLLKIFIQEGMYKNPLYENAETNEESFAVLEKLYEPHFHKFYRPITHEDYLKVMAKPLSSIRKFDIKEADEQMRTYQEEIKSIEHHLKHLTDYAISYFKELLKKYGRGKERKTEIRLFDTIEATRVVANNTKLYCNRKDGFIGTSLKKDEFLFDCADIDDVIVFKADGTFVVVKVTEKIFVGKNIIHAEVFVKNDERKVYNMIYTDMKTGITRAKRFQVLGITREKQYDLTTGADHSKVLYFSSNPNGEAEVVTITLSPTSKAKNKVFTFDFRELDIKGRTAQGNIVTKYPVKSVKISKAGVSTLGATDIWFHSEICRLNKEKMGIYLGKFLEDDRILVIYQNGELEITTFELTNRYDYAPIAHIEKFKPSSEIYCIYRDGRNLQLMLKRFLVENPSVGKRTMIINEHPNSKIIFVTSSQSPSIRVCGKDNTIKIWRLEELSELKSWKSVGVKLPFQDYREISLVEEELQENESASNTQLELF
ncbi:MAG: DNA gyrase/topoisomerase IV subunit A [Cytophagales bacterium]|nr:DNA gyrase/topoisomerase IV subunit A [Cytophagales bacterium]MDW8385103.1 DNA gyrase/topoisomerase IV subunit A [Flammeovirgaceae bacterium]